MKPFLLLSSLFLSFMTLQAEPLKILCVGDSITQGGKRDRAEYTYRYPLQKLLLEAGVSFDFIGSQQKGLHGDATWPDIAPGVPFDPDHEGYYGNKTQQVADKVQAAWTDNTPAPDLVLIHLGTNDQKHGDYAETVKKPLGDFIDFLRSKNPEVTILLGHLNFNDSPGAFRIMAEISELKTAKNTRNSPVLTVHHYQGWTANPQDPASDTFDWAHPNPQGQQKMAEAWWKVMQQTRLL